MENAAAEADADPVGGATEEDPRGSVQSCYLRVVVKARWAAGAEAVSIKAQRSRPTPAIRLAGEAGHVDFRPVASPYEISAIGDQDTLLRRFLENPEVQELRGISAIFELRLDFAREDELTLPAPSTPELRSAGPEGGEPPAPD